MDFVNAYDYLRDARAKLFDWVRPLTQEQYTQKFSSGHGTLRGTLIHMATAEWAFHHRAQAMAMLRQLGVKAESIDYSVLKFKRREV